MLKRLLTKSQASKDRRSWREVMEDHPQVRELLYTSKKLMLQAASGASEVPPRIWHKSLLSLLKETWNEVEAKAVATLVAGFLNNDFTLKRKEEVDC